MPDKVQYEIAKPSDFDELLDFLNFVFSYSARPHEFKKRLPKLYGENKMDEQTHFVAKKDGKIIAAVLICKTEQKVGNTVLKVGGVGSVSAHPYHRKNGHMTALMDMATAEIRRTCDFGVLGGQRQRYAHFGFQPSGWEAEFTLTTANIRKAYSEVDTHGYCFQRLHSCDLDLISACHKLQSIQDLTAIRPPEHFFDIMSSWENELYAITYDGDFIGYTCVSDQDVFELVLNNDAHIKPVLKALSEEIIGKKCAFLLDMYSKSLTDELSAICEQYSLRTCNKFLITNFKKVICAHLSLKTQKQSLNDGDLLLKIDNETIEISVKNGQVTVSGTDNPPQVTLTAAQATSGLFTPMYSQTLQQNLPDFAKSWFPLGLFIHVPDGC